MMKDSVGHIIYVGKAKNLKNRLSSYFVTPTHDQKTTAMLKNVDTFEYFVCATERDALGLEANLIKKHKPHYNILLKDNKSFPYIKIVDAPFPYLEVTRKLTRGGKYFGPYFNGIRAGELLEVIQDIFAVRTCSTKFRGEFFSTLRCQKVPPAPPLTTSLRGWGRGMPKKFRGVNPTL